MFSGNEIPFHVFQKNKRSCMHVREFEQYLKERQWYRTKLHVDRCSVVYANLLYILLMDYVNKRDEYHAETKKYLNVVSICI